MTVSVYVASKTKHAETWRALRASGVKIVSTWIDEAGEGESRDTAALYRRCVEEAAHADVTVFFANEGEEQFGALVEVGAALSHGRLVFDACHALRRWKDHPLVIQPPKPHHDPVLAVDEAMSWAVAAKSEIKP